MRWKPLGSTCMRKRRMNSSGSSVMVVYRSGPSIYGDRALVECFGLRIAALHREQDGEIVQRAAGLAVVRTQRLLLDGYDAAIERLGVRVSPEIHIERLRHGRRP